LAAAFLARSFILGRALGFLDQLRRAPFRLGHDLGGASTRLSDRFFRLSGRNLERLAPLFARRQPSAICFWRASIAPSSGGQTNRTVNQMKSANATACAINEKLMFMSTSSRGDARSRPRYFGITASSGLANANIIARPTPMMNEASIRPSSRNTFACSEFGELGLARSGFEEAAAHDADADAGACRADPDHQADADAGVGLDHCQILQFVHF
jgi:hypothetical protein